MLTEHKYRHMKAKTLIFGSVLTAWTVLIFLFSSQSGERSSDTSTELLHSILNILTSLNIINACDYTSDRIDMLNGILRNAAHFFEYAVLGLLAAFFINKVSMLRYMETKQKRSILFAFAYVLLVSVSDEILQIFIPERCFQISDILTDISGGALGIFSSIIMLKSGKHR